MSRKEAEWKPTELQQRCIDLLKAQGGSMSADMLSVRAGVRRIAVTNAMRALERRGKADKHYWPHTEWGILFWFLKDD